MKSSFRVIDGHLSSSEFGAQYQKYTGRVVLRGEQGSSASQMTAAKVMDIISRPPGCSGQAADAKSAYTHVKMEVASTFSKNPKSDCSDI